MSKAKVEKQPKPPKPVKTHAIYVEENQAALNEALTAVTDFMKTKRSQVANGEVYDHLKLMHKVVQRALSKKQVLEELWCPDGTKRVSTVVE